MSLLCHAGLKRNSARILMLPHDAYDVKLELLRKRTTKYEEEEEI